VTFHDLRERPISIGDGVIDIAVPFGRPEQAANCWSSDVLESPIATGCQRYVSAVQNAVGVQIKERDVLAGTDVITDQSDVEFGDRSVAVEIALGKDRLEILFVAMGRMLCQNFAGHGCQAGAKDQGTPADSESVPAAI
jgi:hypothetical protein